MKRGQALQLNAVDDSKVVDLVEMDVYKIESVGAVKTQGKKWFVNLPLCKGVQKCQLDCAATCILKDKLRLFRKIPKYRLYNSEWMNSLGVFSTQCVIRGKTQSGLGCAHQTEVLAFRGDVYVNDASPFQKS